MKLFPGSAVQQLEFDKIKLLLAQHCRSQYAAGKANELRIHTNRKFIEPELLQTNEYKLIFQNHLNFPDDAVLDLARELKLLSIESSVLSGDQFLQIKKLALAIQQIFRWFSPDRKVAYPSLASIIEQTWFEKNIGMLIDEIIDETGMVKDNASEKLSSIRIALYRKRTELKKVFAKIVSRLNKLGYLTEIEESFMNGRKVLAVFAEQKRMVKGILHGESDSRRTSFIEPEETTYLNNEIVALENEELKEIYIILQQLTTRMRAYHPLLSSYHQMIGEYDFIRAKAKLALDYNGNLPSLHDTPMLHLKNATHPLLFIYNQKSGKPTIPVDLSLDDKKRILVISGPNAGGKTVTLKTAGLLQIMVQCGLLVSCSHDSEFGIFKQLMIHIGDTQSLEFELSTYSSHLFNMKYFMENANGKTMFLIDELGSGSDPNLGGAFAEVIMEELAKKHSLGIVTTHYLNLKVMANKVSGIINGAMAFDEKNLKPLYRLVIGQPGSSYTFAIAERIGLPKELIQKARKLVDDAHFSLDKLLNRTEQDQQQMELEKKHLSKLLAENERLQKNLNQLIAKEKHQQQIELLKEQNRINESKYNYLKEMDRKLKSLVAEWKKTDDKKKVIKMMQAALYKQPEKQILKKKQQKIDDKFVEINKPVNIGDKVKMQQNRQIGTVKEIRGKKAIVLIGSMPITVSLDDLAVVAERITNNESQPGA
jgi:DNA mismatch repair protein MutS2